MNEIEKLRVELNVLQEANRSLYSRLTNEMNQTVPLQRQVME